MGEATRPAGGAARADEHDRDAAARTVREATFDVLRERGLDTIFSNPGSTEIPLLAGLPRDLRFVLALHEGSVVGMATGVAIASGEPAFVLLHTTAGLGNAVAALATARVNRAPLVVVVGQQDRRHLALEPFLAGRLEGLAGEYPVSFDRPAIMDRLAERQGEDAPWPGFEEVRLATIAEGLGCPARRIAGHGELLAVLDEVAPGLASRDEPLLLDVVVAADPTFGE